MKGRRKVCEKCGKEFYVEFELSYYKVCRPCFLAAHADDACWNEGRWRNLRVLTHVHKGPRKEFVWKRREA